MKMPHSYCPRRNESRPSLKQLETGLSQIIKGPIRESNTRGQRAILVAQMSQPVGPCRRWRGCFALASFWLPASLSPSAATAAQKNLNPPLTASGHSFQPVRRNLFGSMRFYRVFLDLSSDFLRVETRFGSRRSSFDRVFQKLFLFFFYFGVFHSILGFSRSFYLVLPNFAEPSSGGWWVVHGRGQTLVDLGMIFVDFESSLLKKKKKNKSMAAVERPRHCRYLKSDFRSIFNAIYWLYRVVF